MMDLVIPLKNWFWYTTFNSWQDLPGAKTTQDVHAAMDLDRANKFNVLATEAPPKGTRKGVDDLEQILISLSS